MEEKIRSGSIPGFEAGGQVVCLSPLSLTLGCSQVGKAPDFDSDSRWFESSHPSLNHIEIYGFVEEIIVLYPSVKIVSCEYVRGIYITKLSIKNDEYMLDVLINGMKVDLKLKYETDYRVQLTINYI